MNKITITCAALLLLLTLASNSTAQGSRRILTYGKACKTALDGRDTATRGGSRLAFRVRGAYPGGPVGLVFGSRQMATELPGSACKLLVDPILMVPLLADRASVARFSLSLPGSVTAGGVAQAFAIGPARQVRASNGLLIEATARPEGCPSICIEDTAMIIGCDDRKQGPTTGTASKAPYNMIGRLSMGCTGTLIAGKYVLTAAHCVYDKNGFRAGPIGFSLGQSGNGCVNQRPFGTRYVVRVFVPANYGSSGSAANKALDLAVLELNAPIAGGKTMDPSPLWWFQMKNRQTTVVGYPGDKPWGTAWYARGKFAASQDSLSLDGGAKGILRVDNDGYGGMSGAPLYVWQAGKRRLVGVFLGSPVSECQLGHTWAARITRQINGHIENAQKYPKTLDFFWRWKTYSGNEVGHDVISGCNN